MIDWAAFLLVALVAVVGSGFVVTVYSTGLRLWSWADTLAGKYSVQADGSVGPGTGSVPGDVASTGRVRSVRALGVVCFVLCALAVLYGIYLIVPQFH